MNDSLNNGLQLKSAMWDAANTLRGSAVDRTDWKGYILPLLFFKRISDVWDEETVEAREIYGEADPSLFPEMHRFVLPEGCHWNDIREVPANVGAALQKAMQEIERANPDTLFRVFGSADWGNKEKFSDELLKDLIEGFSEIGLGNTDVSTDVLGDAYEYLVGKFADVTRRNKAGEFYTPRSVVRMMVEILDPQESESIYDPACGTGGMLLGAIEHVMRKGGDAALDPAKVATMQTDLKRNPPAKFDITRRLQVFSSRVVYVEFEMSGFSLSRKQVPLPEDFATVSDANLQAQISSRLRAPMAAVGAVELKIGDPRRRGV